MNGESSSMRGLADHVVEKDLPLLFLDTCSLLDVIRAPFRHDVAEEAIATVSGALRLVDRQDEIVLAVCSSVPDEFHENLEKVAGELNKHCRSLTRGMTTINRLLVTLGLSPYPPILGDSFRELESRLRELATLLLENAIRLELDDAVKLKAFDRLAARIPPGRRGDQSMDCLIFEELLEFSRHARERGHHGRIVFCTSNTKDYCESRSNPHSEIAGELNSVNVIFTTKLSWAFEELNIQ